MHAWGLGELVSYGERGGSRCGLVHLLVEMGSFAAVRSQRGRRAGKAGVVTVAQNGLAGGEATHR